VRFAIAKGNTMATPRRKSFGDLPKNLQDALSATASFTEIQRIFAIFLESLQADLDCAARSPVKAMRAFVVMEHLKSEFEAFEDKVKSIHHTQATATLPPMFEDMGVPEMPLNEGFKVTVTDKLYCSIRKGKKEEAHEWLKLNGLGDIINPEVNPKTLASAVKEHMQSTGTEPPQEIISTFIQPVASCKKSKAATKGLFTTEESIEVFGALIV
jgi:hypothetical protein